MHKQVRFCKVELRLKLDRCKKYEFQTLYQSRISCIFQKLRADEGNSQVTTFNNNFNNSISFYVNVYCSSAVIA